MPKNIFIRRSPNGGWYGYMSPAPKMPTPDSVREWRDFERMVQSLKTMRVRVVVYSDDLIKLLAKHGITATKPEKAA